MTAASRFDAIVIGSGTAGAALAKDLALAGMRTALLEKGHLGGTCLNVGCTPTKTLLASARMAHLVERSKEYGIESGQVSIRMDRVWRRQRDLVRRFREALTSDLERTERLEVIAGEGYFTSPTAVSVRSAAGDERSLESGRIFIDTGTRTFLPPIEGLYDSGYLDNATILDLEEIPQHLLIIGGGYIGLEYAQMMRRLGAEVTLIHSCEHLLCREDPDVAEAVRTFLAAEGVTFHLNAEVTRVRRSGGLVQMDSFKGGDRLQVEGTHLLLAAGRVPDTEGLGLEAAGVDTDGDGYIIVDHKLRTSVEGVYALGDVKGGPAFTHIAYDDYRIVRGNLLEDRDLSITGRPTPYTLFTDPPLGRVGMTEEEAVERGIPFKTARLEMSRVARAVETGETTGFMKALVDLRNEKILGCAVLGIEGGEVMSMIQIAMMGDLPYTALRDGVFAYPNLADGLNALFSSVKG